MLQWNGSRIIGQDIISTVEQCELNSIEETDMYPVQKFLFGFTSRKRPLKLFPQLSSFYALHLLCCKNGQADRDREKNPRHCIQKRKTFSISKMMFSFETFKKLPCPCLPVHSIIFCVVYVGDIRWTGSGQAFLSLSGHLNLDSNREANDRMQCPLIFIEVIRWCRFRYRGEHPSLISFLFIFDLR
jgi:hypothetical protein